MTDNEVLAYTEQKLTELMERAELEFDDPETAEEVRALIENSGFTKRQLIIIVLIASRVSTGKTDNPPLWGLDIFRRVDPK